MKLFQIILLISSTITTISCHPTENASSAQSKSDQYEPYSYVEVYDKTNKGGYGYKLEVKGNENNKYNTAKLEYQNTLLKKPVEIQAQDNLQALSKTSLSVSPQAATHPAQNTHYYYPTTLKNHEVFQNIDTSKLLNSAPKIPVDTTNKFLQSNYQNFDTSKFLKSTPKAVFDSNKFLQNGSPNNFQNIDTSKLTNSAPKVSFDTTYRSLQSGPQNNFYNIDTTKLLDSASKVSFDTASGKFLQNNLQNKIQASAKPVSGFVTHTKYVVPSQSNFEDQTKSVVKSASYTVKNAVPNQSIKSYVPPTINDNNYYKTVLPASTTQSAYSSSLPLTSTKQLYYAPSATQFVPKIATQYIPQSKPVIDTSALLNLQSQQLSHNQVPQNSAKEVFQSSTQTFPKVLTQEEFKNLIASLPKNQYFLAPQGSEQIKQNFALSAQVPQFDISQFTASSQASQITHQDGNQNFASSASQLVPKQFPQINYIAQETQIGQQDLKQNFVPSSQTTGKQFSQVDLNQFSQPQINYQYVTLPQADTKLSQQDLSQITQQLSQNNAKQPQIDYNNLLPKTTYQVSPQLTSNQQQTVEFDYNKYLAQKPVGTNQVITYNNNYGLPAKSQDYTAYVPNVKYYIPTQSNEENKNDAQILNSNVQYTYASGYNHGTNITPNNHQIQYMYVPSSEYGSSSSNAYSNLRRSYTKSEDNQAEE